MPDRTRTAERYARGVAAAVAAVAALVLAANASPAQSAEDRVGEVTGSLAPDARPGEHAPAPLSGAR
ncbi:hypothetical protein [Streptomyces sp. NPDC003719]